MLDPKRNVRQHCRRQQSQYVEVATIRVGCKHVLDESEMEGHNKVLQICGRRVGRISVKYYPLRMTDIRVAGLE